MVEMVAFLYDKHASDLAYELLTKENIHAEVLSTKMGPVGFAGNLGFSVNSRNLGFPANSDGYRILVADEDAEKANRILKKNNELIMRAGVEPKRPLTAGEKCVEYLGYAVIAALSLLLFLTHYE